MSEKTNAAPATTIAEYSPTAEALAELRQKYQGVVFSVNTTAGMIEARAARGELRTLRVSLEAKRKEIKEPALTRCREIDTEAKRITAELSALEDPIDDLIKAEEQRKEREKAAKEEAERQRIAEINRRFEEVRGLARTAPGKTVGEISALIAQAEAFDPASLDEEFRPAGVFERQLAINGLKALRDQREAQDQKDAETAEKLKKLEAMERAEAERLAAEQAGRDRKAAEEAEAARQREAQEAQERAQRDAAEREALRQREAEIAERERVAAAERAEADRIAREERERLAAEQRKEAERVAAEQRAEAERQDAERRRLALERERLEQEQEAREISQASLLQAAAEALPLLQQGYPRHKATKKLAAALAREQKQAA